MAVAAEHLRLVFPGVSPAVGPMGTISSKELAQRILATGQRGKEEPAPWTIEAQSGAKDVYVNDLHKNAFVGAAIHAFSNHYPLELKPDHFWLLVLQGISRHVEMHAEQLRSKFVNFMGKKELLVFADDFVLGSPDNDWPRIFPAFVKQIEENTVADVVPRLETHFSTSTPTDILAGKITLMDVCKSFFEYTVMTRCGFPSIILHGTRADWFKLQDKITAAMALCEPGFASGWGAALTSVTRKFLQAFDGTTDADFWQGMVKKGGTLGSGARTWYSGWINVFFPYQDARQGIERNPFCVPYRPDAGYVRAGLGTMYSEHGRMHDTRDMTFAGLEPQTFPTGWSETPAKWDYLGTVYTLAFRAGFVGVKQDPATLAVTPEVGWLVLRSAAPSGSSKRITDDDDDDVAE